jgi:hypothetical protein
MFLVRFFQADVIFTFLLEQVFVKDKNCLLLNFRAPYLSGMLLCSGVCRLKVCYVMRLCHFIFVGYYLHFILTDLLNYNNNF